MRYDTMSIAHRRTRNLIKAGDNRKYKVIFVIALRAVHMMYRECTNADINYLKAMHLKGMVNLSLLESFHMDNTYQMNFQSDGLIRFTHKNPYYIHGKSVTANFN